MTIKEKKERVYRLNEDLEVVESALADIDEALDSISNALGRVNYIGDIDDGDGCIYNAVQVEYHLNDAESEAEEFKDNLRDIRNKITKELEELEEQLGGVYEFTELSGDALLNAINKIKTLHSDKGSNTYSIDIIIKVAERLAFDCGGNIISVDESEV